LKLRAQTAAGLEVFRVPLESRDFTSLGDLSALVHLQFPKLQGLALAYIGHFGDGKQLFTTDSAFVTFLQQDALTLTVEVVVQQDGLPHSVPAQVVPCSGAESLGARSPSPLKVTVIGSGNWGSVAARVCAQNTLKYEDFDDEVRVWVFEEIIRGKKLTDIINEKHQNVKYLPGVDLGPNVKAIPDVKEACEGSDLLIFVTPHQFVKGLLPDIKQVIHKDTKAISLIKGWDVTEDGFQLISKLIQIELNIDCSVLMGANIASDIAKEEFSEATVGFPTGSRVSGLLWQKLFDRPYFQVTSVPDVAGCELCGTMKNVVALGAGFVDGLGLGSNSKAAIMRIGLKEMRGLCKHFFPSIRDETFFESAGIADLITTCFGGRNRQCAEAFAKAAQRGRPKTWETIEKELLNGQKLQGVLTSYEVQTILKNNDLESTFPLITTIHHICKGDIKPEKIVDYAELPSQEYHMSSSRHQIVLMKP
jgi:glycerol-3-phosphate dehydrogenase (NAD+)